LGPSIGHSIVIRQHDGRTTVASEPGAPASGSSCRSPGRATAPVPTVERPTPQSVVVVVAASEDADVVASGKLMTERITVPALRSATASLTPSIVMFLEIIPSR